MTKQKKETKEKQNISIEKYNEMENCYKRALADYQNLSNRTEIEKMKTIKYANENMLKKIIVILDDLEESYKYTKDKGTEKIIEKFKRILSDLGVSVYGEAKDEFDPNYHEAIETINGEINKIVKVHQKGYKFDDKPIRPAIVSVGNGNK